MEALQSEIVALRKDVSSLMKLVRKIRTFQDDPSGEKVKERTKNNGFIRPMAVSEELRSFLGLQEGETISRSMVTRRLNEYIKANGLKHPDNGRILILDDKLTALLKPPEGVQITFLNVQKYLSPHYTKIDLPPEEKPQEAVVEESQTTGGDEPEVSSAASAPPKKASRPTVKKATTKA